MSLREQGMLNNIENKLKFIHKKDFNIIPFIGWDICLTNDGPYLFEGNFISGMFYYKELNSYYIEECKKLY